MLYGYGTRDMERENDPQFVTEVPHQRERHADTMLVTVVNDESENFERLLAIVEHIATDGAEITPELVAEAREVLARSRGLQALAAAREGEDEVC